MENPDVQENNRNPDGTFKPGISGNPAGRPKGQTLKEYWRQRFMNMTDEEKIEFTAKVGNAEIWKMAEGNPQNDVTSGGEPIVMNVIKYEDSNDSSPIQP